MIGVHVCEGCGAVYDAIGPWLGCRESHQATCAICGGAGSDPGCEPADRWGSYCSLRCYLRSDEHARRKAAFLRRIEAL